MEKLQEYSTVYTIGALGYSAIEIAWRGFTHWSMAITGGVCFLSLYLLNIRKPKWPLWKKCLTGSLIITAAEFFVGCIVNKLLCLNVWDYSARPLNVMGQICPLFSCLWFLLCIPVFYIAKRLKKHTAENPKHF